MSNWTKDQENAIYDNGGTLLVSAAAGSGKTSVLVERVIEKLTNAENPIDADRLLIVTFSNAAAREMKERIHKRLSELLKNDEMKYVLSRQLFLLENANISTIHSFCIKLLRQHFEYVDISPNFRIADEGEIIVLKSVAINRVLEDYYKKNDTDFLDLVELLSSFRDDNDLIQTVFRLHKSVRAYPFFNDWLEEKLSQYESALEKPLESAWADVVFDYSTTALTHAKDTIDKAVSIMREDDLKAKYLPSFLADKKMVEQALEFSKARNLDGLYNLIYDYSFPSLSSVRNYADTEFKDYIASMRNFVKDVIDDVKTHVCTDESTFKADILLLLPKIRKLFELTGEFDRVLFELKKEKNIIDFSDVEQLTLKLLMQKQGGNYVATDIAKSLRDNFDEILIDEYQDTNAAQDMIFCAISKDESNMFMVGDVKQSIYQFRQAMPKLFVDKQNNFSKYNKKDYPAVIHLSENFRSRFEVTSSINFFFSLLMSEEFGQVNYDKDEALKCGATYPEMDGYVTEVDIVNLKDSEYSNAGAQAVHIAKRILGMMETAKVTTKNGVRNATFSDFCILSRSPSTTAEEYRKVLEQFGIRTYYDTTQGCLTSYEISILLSLLKIVNNPTSNIDLICVLYSFVYGFNSDDLAKIRIIDRKNSLYANMISLCETDSDIKEKCELFLKDISDFRTQATKLSIAEFVEFVFERTGYRELIMARFNEDTKTSNLELFKTYCAEFDTRPNASLDSFLRYIDRLIAEGGNMPGVNKTSENSGAVRIMSIHHSKGLEFPFCFVTDLSKGFNTEDISKKSVLHSELGFACVRRDEKNHAQYNTIPLSAVRLAMSETKMAEELRMLYVALTRAREKLVLVMSASNNDTLIKNLLKSNPEAQMSPYFLKNSSSFAKWLLLCLLRKQDFKLESGARFIETSPATFDAEIKVNFIENSDDETEIGNLELNEISETDEAIESYIKESLCYKYPFESSSAIFSKASVTDITKKEFLQPMKELSFDDESEFDGAKRGSVIHKFMQFCDYKLAVENLGCEVERLKSIGVLENSETQNVDFEILAKFFESNIAKRIVNSDFVKREMKFTLLLSADYLDKNAPKDDEIIVQGIADCVFKDGDDVVVLDFKTDKVDSSEILVERYSEQLYLYKKAIEKIFPNKEIKMVIYSFFLNETIELN